MRGQTGGSRPGGDPALMDVAAMAIVLRAAISVPAHIIPTSVRASPHPVRRTAFY